MERLQVLIGDLTIEQFSKLIGFTFGLFVLFTFPYVFSCAIIDGWAFRKGALYYGSLRYLNKCFKKLRNCNSLQELDLTHVELRSVICLLRFQRVIPKIMYKHLLNKLLNIFVQRKSEFLDDEYIFNPF